MSNADVGNFGPCPAALFFLFLQSKPGATHCAKRSLRENISWLLAVHLKSGAVLSLDHWFSHHNPNSVWASGKRVHWVHQQSQPPILASTSLSELVLTLSVLQLNAANATTYQKAPPIVGMGHQNHKSPTTLTIGCTFCFPTLGAAHREQSSDSWIRWKGCRLFWMHVLLWQPIHSSSYHGYDRSKGNSHLAHRHKKSKLKKR